MGHHTQDLSAQGYGVLAIDVHTPGICRIADFVFENDITNVRVHLGDGIPILTSVLAPGCVDELHIMFPDPWPKARHNKRRVIQHSLFELADRVLALDGTITMVTDDDDYAQHIKTILTESPLFELASKEVNIPVTRYKRRADHMKNAIHGFIAKRK
jgi:tRNA (guanine-N7-)-methyltransferase